MKKPILIAIVAVVILIIIGGGFYLFSGSKNNQNNEQSSESTSYDVKGMKIEVLTEGTGDESKKGDKVTVDYVGTLENGTKFDSSIDRGIPFSFTLGENRVIQGWELGVLGMKVGEKRRLTIPSDLGYGEFGAGDIIPANATLIFEVSLLGINQ